MYKISIAFILLYFYSIGLPQAQIVEYSLDGNTIRQNEHNIETIGHEFFISIGLFSGGALRTGQSFFINNNQNSFYPASNVTSTVEKSNTMNKWFTLTNNNQVVIGYNSVTGATDNGYFDMHYKLNNIKNYAWKAGLYYTDLYFSLVNINLFSYITPEYNRLQINVPGFIDLMVPINQYKLTIDNFHFFRQGFESQLVNNISAVHSLPYNFSIKSFSNLFNYTEDNVSVINSTSPVSALQVKNTLPNNSAYYRLSNNYQQLDARAIPVGNTSTYQQQFFISSNDLKQYFLNKGTYSNSLQYQLISSNPDYPLTKNLNINLSIEVPDLSELFVSQDQVDLVFDDRNDYQQGVSKEIKNHITVSKTSGFHVSVKANSPYFQLGSSRIPVSILSIGPAQGETKVLNISNLSTVNQTLINSDQAVLDQNYDIKYSIASEHVPSFLASPKGIYSTTLTYTITAQ